MAGSESTPTNSSSLNALAATTAAKVQALHSDELLHLAQNRFKMEKGWFRVCIAYTATYVKFLICTWVNLAKSIFGLLSFKLDLLTFGSYLLFTTLASIVTFLLLIWCILAHSPIFSSIFYHFSQEHAESRGLVNAIYDMFHALDHEQAQLGKDALSQPPMSFTADAREFNIDAAKLLLQFASLMYERTATTTNVAVNATKKLLLAQPSLHNDFKVSNYGILSTGTRLAGLLGQDQADEVSQILNQDNKQNTIRQFTEELNIMYQPASQLNTLSSAYCALFWDPSSNWIVVAFKGTSPTEFDEWMTDLNLLMRSAAEHIEKFSKVHGGFLDRMFPTTGSGEISPYDTIADSIREVASDLLKVAPPNAKINVWFTGHSLGCATASLAYCKMLCNETQFSKRVVLRDAYLFAAPVVCDVISSEAFNDRMNDPKKIQRTMWRITNMQDIVATGLPAYGDNPKFRKMREAPYADGDIFMFSHLGTEIKMKSKPAPCNFKGMQFPQETKVEICSSLDPQIVGVPVRGTRLHPLARWSQHIPFVGRFIQHGTSFYWDQLQRVGAGNCEFLDS